MSRPLLITALRIEHNALKRLARERDLDLRCLGPGDACAERLSFIELPPFALLAGVAGGLVDDPPRGTARVIDHDTGESFTPTFDHNPQGATIVTVSEPANSPDDKRALARTHDVHLVECESAHFARACEAADVPWGVVRTISDGPAEALPPQAAGWIDDHGNTRTPRVLLDTLKAPKLIPALIRLGRNTNRALRELEARVRECLDAHA